MDGANATAVGARCAEARGPVHIEVRELRYARGTRRIFDGLSCSFLRDRINVILGGSGAGKTTLLRMLGCLARPDSGSILVDGELDLTRLSDAGIRRFRRRIGMMFQEGALLDSLSVFDNVALPLREHTELTEQEIRRQVEEVFASVGLEEVGPLLPAQLSGGMRKRSALARALVMHPEILLCDEPFSGLDPATVRLVEDLLVDLNHRLNVTMVLASHHVASTFRMADRIVLLVEGSAIEGAPADFQRHADPRVAAFFAGELA
jgi:phospholipid/cholesterol/gamma-HCH transport system ATP-binding protein